MLVVTRKRGQSIIVGDNVRVTVVAIGEDQVRVGIEAPPEIAVYREELYEAIKRENLEAARTSLPSPAADLPKPSQSPKKSLPPNS
jgi:carbon storage regulator